MAEGIREVHIASDGSEADLTGTLPLGAHPDGELTFEDGTALVSAEVASVIAERYPNLEVGESPVTAPSTGADDTEDADVEQPVAEPPLDPTDHTVDELRDALAGGDFDAAALDAIEQAERAGQDRSTARDVINAASGE